MGPLNRKEEKHGDDDYIPFLRVHASFSLWSGCALFIMMMIMSTNWPNKHVHRQVVRPLVLPRKVVVTFRLYFQRLSLNSTALLPDHTPIKHIRHIASISILYTFLSLVITRTKYNCLYFAVIFGIIEIKRRYANGQELEEDIIAHQLRQT